MSKKESQKFKLYHGTSETIAKVSCIKGLSPYKVPVVEDGVPRKILASTESCICLTAECPGLMASEMVNSRERWGIIEIDASLLSSALFLPHELFLTEKLKPRSEEEWLNKLAQTRENLVNNRHKWRNSMDEFCFCVYEGPIPLSAITRVAIYDPRSNPAITKAVVSAPFGTRFYKLNSHRQGMVVRWFMGEDISPEEWLGSSAYAKMDHSAKNQISQVLRNKQGLDIFYQSSPNGKKSSW